MESRVFANLGFECSRFGLGCMRLPLQKQADGSTKDSDIDEVKAIELIRYAIDNGVTYVDTAHGYHGGNSKIVLGKALKDGYRDKVKIATKLPPWNVNEPADMEKLLDVHLEALGTDCIDFFLLHALDKKNWKKLKDMGVLEFLDKMKEKGKILYPSFSFHDDLDTFKEIIDAYNWSMCQIQLNYLDTQFQAGLEGLRYAASKGIAVVVMEPLKGGKLANVPKDIQAKFDSSPIKRNPASWAFHWLANFPEVTVIISGSSTLEQVKDSIATFETTGINKMSQAELELINEVKQIYERKTKIGCTACSYCMPCPCGVDIPEIFKIYNNASVFEDYDSNCRSYKNLIEKGKSADLCTNCGNCESVCPQALPIIETLKEAHAFFTK